MRISYNDNLGFCITHDNGTIETLGTEAGDRIIGASSGRHWRAVALEAARSNPGTAFEFQPPKPAPAIDRIRLSARRLVGHVKLARLANARRDFDAEKHWAAKSAALSAQLRTVINGEVEGEIAKEFGEAERREAVRQWDRIHRAVARISGNAGVGLYL